MIYDWGVLIDRLRKCPLDWHRFRPPCPHDRVAAAERQLHTVPEILKDMLQHFNGAELFVGGLPMLTLFGLTTAPTLSPLEWAEKWYIDQFTPTWRASGPNREDDWAIGMTNYGGLILFNESHSISEWDTGEGRWLLKKVVFDEWLEKMISDGEAMMADQVWMKD